MFYFIKSFICDYSFAVKKKFQSGRSMIEILGVLAIIGVLSIAALSGFSYAMNRHKANETIHDVMLRATNVPMIDEHYVERVGDYEWKFAGLPEDGQLGSFYRMHTVVSDLNEYIYRVVVSDVPKRVCRQVLSLNPTDIDAIYVEGDKPSDEECPNELNTMAFYFDEYGTGGHLPNPDEPGQGEDDRCDPPCDKCHICDIDVGECIKKTCSIEVCPDGQVSSGNDECGCIKSCIDAEGTECSQGADTNYTCCITTYMEETCGALDNPIEHIWIQDGTEGNGKCCCTRDESEDCCDADGGIWSNGHCCSVDTPYWLDNVGCIECLNDAHCLGNTDGRTICDIDTHTCVSGCISLGETCEKGNGDGGFCAKESSSSSTLVCCSQDLIDIKNVCCSSVDKMVLRFNSVGCPYSPPNQYGECCEDGKVYHPKPAISGCCRSPYVWMSSGSPIYYPSEYCDIPLPDEYLMRSCCCPGLNYICSETGDCLEIDEGDDIGECTEICTRTDKLYKVCCKGGTPTQTAGGWYSCPGCECTEALLPETCSFGG